jgi:subtilisin family serine protease
VAAAVPAAVAARSAPRTGRLLVTLAPSSGVRPAAVAAAAGAGTAGTRVPRLRLVAVRPRPGGSLRALAARLRRDPRVRRVEVEHRAAPRAVPSDPALTAPETAVGTAPGTTVQWWASRVNLPAAWDLHRGEGARVAVIDTGVDATHPELAGRIADAADFGTGGPPTEDPVGHGTHVASLACGSGDDGVGLAGAGLRCRLLVARTDFSDLSVAAAITWAADHDADAIAMSFGTAPGTRPSRTVADALAYARRRGSVLVAAAADEPVEDQGYPASLLQPAGTGPDRRRGAGLAVTAANASDARAWFAGFGTQVSLAAYGAYARRAGPPGIFGAFTTAPNALERGNATADPPQPACRCRTTFAGDPRYAYLRGTSMATPVVAAVAALVRRLNPGLGPVEVVRLLKDTARRAGGWTPDLGWGILDAGAALRGATRLDSTAPRSRLRAGARRTRRTSVLLRWSGRDAGPPRVHVSGVARFEVWRRAGRARWRRIAVTRSHVRRVRVRRGSRYAFATVAVDRAGNRERLPARPDARVTALR